MCKSVFFYMLLITCNHAICCTKDETTNMAVQSSDSFSKKQLGGASTL